MEIKGTCSINGEIIIPGDKSISHRSAIISSLADKGVKINNYLFSEDCLATLDVLKKLGVSISGDSRELTVRGCGLSRMKESSRILEVGNSGTCIRLISGVLAGNNMMSVLSGDSSINSRPMARIIDPLNQMGARVYGRNDGKNAPIVIFGSSGLEGKIFDLAISSAQVKSCIMLAALHARGITEIYQPQESRDHTERMLEYFDAAVEYDGKHVRVDPSKKLCGKDISVPGDISSALYFIVAALVLKDSHISLKGVGVNPTRNYALDVLASMGGNIEIKNKRLVCNEPVADIEASTSSLMPAKITEDRIPNIIDEIPILSVAAAAAGGKTVFNHAQELRNKETDRISAIANQYRKAGVDVTELKDGLVINGKSDLCVKGGSFDSMGDHRIAMSLAVLSMLGKEKATIENTACINTSFPGFEELLDTATSKNE